MGIQEKVAQRETLNAANSAAVQLLWFIVGEPSSDMTRAGYNGVKPYVAKTVIRVQ